MKILKRLSLRFYNLSVWRPSDPKPNLLSSCPLITLLLAFKRILGRDFTEKASPTQWNHQALLCKTEKETDFTEKASPTQWNLQALLVATTSAGAEGVHSKFDQWPKELREVNGEKKVYNWLLQKRKSLKEKKVLNWLLSQQLGLLKERSESDESKESSPFKVRSLIISSINNQNHSSFTVSSI